MHLTVYASDVRDFDEEVERNFNIEHVYGHGLFDDNDRLDVSDYDYALEPHTYLSIMVDMQEQLNDLRNQVELQKKWIKTIKEEINGKP